MTFSAKDISHIAQLARLDLTDQEIKQYRQELSGIVRYVDQLQKIKVKKGSMETTREQIPSWRLDEVKSWIEAERRSALDQAPYKEGKQIKVRRILG